ncbi:hypothetical protein TNCV_1330911 [Trichonephila clavipes]|uniref:Uncharacterized protein n=1 Tax=Trichonephila clavipes TaxID=2585209 RepID=A0A8X6R7I9_TRICX|nr:hypothetical protein TNCV_1330911 [Trichonephila clavipes]
MVRPLSRPQSPFIEMRNRSVPSFPHCSLIPLVLGDNRLACLIPTTKRYHVHHLVAITRIVKFPLRVGFCPYLPILLSIQVFCDPDVSGEPKQLMPIHKASFLQSVVTNDSSVYWRKKFSSDIKATHSSKQFTYVLP